MWLRRYSCHDFRPKAGVRNEFPSFVVLFFFFFFRPPRPALFSPASASEQRAAWRQRVLFFACRPRTTEWKRSLREHSLSSTWPQQLRCKHNTYRSKQTQLKSALHLKIESFTTSQLNFTISNSFPLFLSFPFPPLPLLIFLISRLLSLLPGALPRPRFGALAHYPRLSRGSRCGARAPPYNP